MQTVESRAWWRYMRCVVAQGIMKALLWVVMLGAAGYAAFHSPTPCNGPCIQQQKISK